MNPVSLLALGVGVLLLWYAFTGASPIATLKATVAPGTAKAKTVSNTGNNQNGG